MVIDNGSDTFKAGFAGEDFPLVLPTVVGSPKLPGVPISPGMEYKDPYIADEAVAKRGSLSLRYPVQHGIVTNWDDMEQLWLHTFYKELKVAPEEQPVLLTEPPLNPSVSRRRMTQVMFETFNVPAMYVGNHAALSLFATGRSTGVVVECGLSVARTVPVWEGRLLPTALKTVDVGGGDLDDFFMRMMNDRGYNFITAGDRDLARYIKEDLCYVAQDYDDELAEATDWSNLRETYELPDGTEIMIGNERFRCSEALFQPSLIGTASPGVHEVLFQSISRCGVDMLMPMYGNIVVSGGTTMLDGFVERLTKEMVARAPPNLAKAVNVIAQPNRQYGVWLGGSALASHSSFNEIQISREEYDEAGPAIVDRKCF